MNILLCIFLLGIVQSDTTQKIVNYSSKNIVYYPSQNRVVLIDSAQVTYKDLVVDADSIEYDIKAKTLSAFKNVRFMTSTEKVDGNELFYNLDTKRGLMRNAKTTVENGFVRGKEIWLVKEKTLEIVDGYYTTCDLDPPHYYFYCKKAKILLDNTAIAQNVILKVEGIPCVAVPFWFFPISKQRKSGLLPFKFGQSASEGRYAKGVSYYWVINDYADMTFALDVMEKKGFQPKLEAIYIINPFARGQILSSYIRETDTKRHRYSLNVQHHSQFLFQSYLDAYIDFQSDQSYLPDYADNTAQWLKKELYSQISLNRDFKNIGRTSLLIERSQDFENSTLTWKQPNFSVNFYSVPLISNWNFTPGFKFANTKTTYDSTATSARERKVSARLFNTSFSFSNPRTIFGAFNLPIGMNYKATDDQYKDSITNHDKEFNANTGFSTSQTIFQAFNISEGINYNHAVSFNENTVANVTYDFNFGSNVTLYRLFGMNFFGIENILHRVTPSISYNLRPTTNQYRFWGIPKLDTTPQTSNIGFALNNLFQGKFNHIAEKRDLANVGLQSSYDFMSHALSPLSLNSDLYFVNAKDMHLITNVNLTYPWELRPISRVRVSNFSVNTNFNYSFTKKDTVTQQGQGITITINHYYTANSDGLSSPITQSNMLNGIISIAPKGWRFDITTGYNLKQKSLTDYSISIWKDLHCWEAIVNINRLGSQWAYDFKVRIKKIPDVALGKGILGFVVPLQ
jgi:lipopolysaccharide assembly outer membrane protein LptD (OstA)